MKNIIIIFLFIYSLPSFVQADDEIGIITAVKGIVSITDQSGLIDALEGTPVKLGDTVETGEQSGVKILFDDDTLFSLGDNTSVTINEFIYTPQERKSISNITKGKMRAIVQKVQSGQSDVEINTPNGLAGVKGTTLYANADEDTFCLKTGQIIVQGTKSQESITLRPDECTHIINGKPISPEKMSEETWLKFKRETDIAEGAETISSLNNNNYPGKNGSSAAPPLSSLINISQFPSVPPFNQSPLDNSIIPVTVNVNIN